MKIHLLSDLHLSLHPMTVPSSDADVVVLAGDLGRPIAAIEWAKQFDRPTIFVPGNHEFYGSDLASTLDQLRERANGTSVQVLDRDEWHFGAVRFLGCTLWSDHRLYESPEAREIGMKLAIDWVRDFSRIDIAPDRDQKLTPAVCQAMFDSSVAWLEDQFDQQHDGPTVVVTHFAPSRRSIHPRFKDSPINACFVSDLETRILKWQPKLWLHGHTHDSFDYRIGATRVVANPRGYAPNGEIENKLFNPARVLDLMPFD